MPLLGLGVAFTWAAILLATTGSPLEAPSDHDLGATIAERLGRVEAIAHDPAPLPVHPGIGSLLAAARTHPAALAKTYLSDAANLVANPGYAGFTDYLNLFSTYRGGYWTEIRDRAGYGGVLRYIGRRAAGAARNHGGGARSSGSPCSASPCTEPGASTACAGGFGSPACPGSPASRSTRRSSCSPPANVRWTHRTPTDPLVAIAALKGALRRPRDARQ